MGCPVSKPGEQNVDIVSLCRERKQLIKSAVDRRFALADAHCKYIQSLYGVALAIRMFIAKHSTTFSSPLLITPQSSGPTRPTNESMEDYPPQSPPSSVSERENSISLVQDIKENGDDHKRVDPPPPPPSYSFGWDFLELFDVVNGFDQTYGVDDLTVVREGDEISELEDSKKENVEETVVGNGEKSGDNANVSQGDQMGVGVMDEEKNGMGLLEALKDVEEGFIRVYESGFDLSKLLEANVVHPQSHLKEIKESPKKIVKAISWRISSSSRSTKSSSTSSESDNDLLNDVLNDSGGMKSGIHSSTLGILYAWEKKLYEQVKAGHEMRKIYERKLLHLNNKDPEGFGSIEISKTKAEIRSLYSKIMVTMQTASSISIRIQKLRDQELQPQLLELLYGLARNWRVMFESHQAQNRTMSQVKSFTTQSPVDNSLTISRRHSTLQLETKLQKWCARFSNYIFSQKSYVEALSEYLSMSVTPCENNPFSANNSLPMLEVCHNWLNLINNLPDKKVSDAIKNFAKDIRGLWVQQGVEEQHKRKVDGLIKEVKKREKILELKTSCEEKSAKDLRNRAECTEEKKVLLVQLKKRVDEEKAKHQELVQESTRIGLHAFQSGFLVVFQSLDEFSRACVDMYSVLVASGENAKERIEKAEYPF